jgi:hypothetical protein
MLRSLIAISLLLLTQAPLPAAVPNEPYVFTRVAETRREFTLIDSHIPEMMETGDVYFVARPPGAIQQLWVGNGVPNESVSGTGIIASPLGVGRTNSAGEVVFSGRIPGVGLSTLIFHRAPGEEPEIIYDVRGSASTVFGSFMSEPSLNDAGQVAFVATGQGLPEAIFVGDREGTFPTTALASTGGPLWEGYTEFVRNPILLGDGSVVMRADRGDIHGLYHFTAPGVSETILETGGAFSEIGEFDVGASGDAIISAFEASSGRQVAVLKTNTSTTVLPMEGGIRGYSYVGINDFGQYVLLGYTSPGADVIMVGQETQMERLIGVGDTLFGGTVQVLYAGPSGINNSGQIAFYAVTSNNPFGGIYIATPPARTIPEPATVAVTIALAVALCGAGHLKRRPRLPARP